MAGPEILHNKAGVPIIEEDIVPNGGGMLHPERERLPTLAEVRQRFDNLLSGCITGKGPDEYNLLLDRLLAATVEQRGGKK